MDLPSGSLGVWCFVDRSQTGVILKPGINSFLGRSYNHIELGGNLVADSGKEREKGKLRNIFGNL